MAVGYFYKVGKCWDCTKLWEATKDNPVEDVNVESFIQQDVYWNFGTFKELAEEMKLVLDADYSYPVIVDEEYSLVDGAHRIVHAYLDGVKTIKGVIIANDQWPEADYDEVKAAKQYQDGKVTSDTSFSSHCHYNCGMCEFITDIARCTKHGIKYNDIRPATNEERDILFAKMR